MLANFLQGVLMVQETRVIAELLLLNPTQDEWHDAIMRRNVLQKKTLNTARSFSTLIRRRLELVDAELLEKIVYGDLELATQCVMACLLNYSPFLGDFMRGPMRDEYRRLSLKLESRVWNVFFYDRAIDCPELLELSDSTQNKLRQNAFKILSEAGFLSKDSNRYLQRVRVLPELKRYLSERDFPKVMGALECATLEG